MWVNVFLFVSKLAIRLHIAFVLSNKAVCMKMADFWVVVLFSLGDLYQRFRGPYSINLRDRPDDGGSKVL
jgi:hypothetical protein